MVLLSTYFTFILSAFGLPHGKIAIVYLLYSYVFFLLIYNKVNIHFNKETVNLILLFTLFQIFYIINGYLISPAAGYKYFNSKIILSLAQIYVPTIIILLINNIKEGELKFIKYFIFNTTILFGIWILIIFIPQRNLILEGNFFARLSMGSANPNWIARFMSIGFLILFSKDVVPKRKILKFFLLIFILFSMILTGSKIVIFFTLPMAMIYAISLAYKDKDTKKIMPGLLSFVGIIVVLTVIFFAIFNAEAIGRRFGLKSRTVGIRLANYYVTLKDFFSRGNYFLGNGVGSTSQIVSFSYDIRWYPHNIFIEILYELGLAGLILYFLPLIYGFYRSISKRKNWVFFVLVLYFLFAQTSGDITGNNYIPIFLALFFIYHNYSRNVYKKDKKVK